jgi:hypothetical protein
MSQRRPLSFNRHGPFYQLQLRLGLITDADLHAGRRAALFMALAWVPAAVLAVLEGNALGPQVQRAMLHNFAPYAFAIAIGAMVLMEQASEGRMTWLIGEFAARGILTDAARDDLKRAEDRMTRRTGSWMMELAVLFGAYLVAFDWLKNGAVRVEGGSAYGHLVGGSFHPTLAGWWLALVTLPLFLFLCGRWLWRFLIWGRLLRDLAGCELRLVPTHADRCGGLAFIGRYPATYQLFAFAFSVVVSATVLNQVTYEGAPLEAFLFALVGTILALVLMCVLPLFAFTPVLIRLKRQGLSHYGALVSSHDWAFNAKWITGASPESQAESLGSPDISSLADLSTDYQLVDRILPVPITTASIVPLLLAGLLPIAIVGLTQLPLEAVIAVLKRLIQL